MDLVRRKLTEPDRYSEPSPGRTPPPSHIIHAREGIRFKVRTSMIFHKLLAESVTNSRSDLKFRNAWCAERFYSALTAVPSFADIISTIPSYAGTANLTIATTCYHRPEETRTRVLRD